MISNVARESHLFNIVFNSPVAISSPFHISASWATDSVRLYRTDVTEKDRTLLEIRWNSGKNVRKWAALNAGFMIFRCLW